MNETQTLRDLVLKAKDSGLSYRQMEEKVAAAEAREPRGLRLNRTTASRIARGTHGGDAEDGTIRAIALVAGVPDHVAFAAAGRRTNGPPFADQLPAGVDDLDPRERRVALDLLRVLVAQRQELNDYAEQPATDTADPTPAARAQGTEDEKTQSISDLREDIVMIRDYLHSGEFDEAAGYAERAEQALTVIIGDDLPLTDLTAAYAEIKPTDLSERRSRREAGSSAPSNLTTDDVLHLVAPTAGSQPDSLAASAHWPDGKEVTSDEYEGYKRWIADGTSDGWLQYRLIHQAGAPAAAHDQGASDEGESDRARREQDEAVEGSQDDE